MTTGPRRAGLVDAAGYVPRYRLSGSTVAAVWGGGSGERAVANYDEDALTMAIEATLLVTDGRDPARLGACLFASTSAPYVEKSSAALLATVVDAPADIVTADVGGSLRAGTTALKLALDTVSAGSADEAIVAAGNMRPAPPGSELELAFGDGGGAVLVGTDDLVATFEGACTLSHDFTDVWRNDGDRYVQTLADPAFVRAYGLDRHVGEAVEGLLRRTGRKRTDLARVVLYAPDARTHAALVRELQLPEAAVATTAVVARVGNTGVASCLLGLAAALETAAAGDQVLVVSYGNGAEALLFETTERVHARRPRRPVSAQIDAGRPLTEYGKLLRFRRHVETEVVRSFSSVPALVREERQNLRLYGQKCSDCGAVSYPRRHLCWQCASNRLVDHRLARRGRVFTFTKDHLVPNPDPPTVMVAADLDGGGRFYGQLTDADPAAVGFDMAVELTFRRLHEGDGYVNYFWKLRPAAGAGTGA
jgi:3-hydroxy-3-methylglutaryl CoA synthase